jgi:hypothetical protein
MLVESSEMMVADVVPSQNWKKKNNNSAPNLVTASKNIMSFCLQKKKNRRKHLIHGKFNNTVTESLYSSIVIDKLDELE